jgi:hypothetical protein
MRVSDTSYAATLGTEVAVTRAAQLLMFKLMQGSDTLRKAIESGPLEFKAVARAELRGLGLSSADLGRVFQILSHSVQMTASRGAQSSR